ncbi:MAG: DUF3048 domain-containing protein [Acidimicrobiia bacterium]
MSARQSARRARAEHRRQTRRRWLVVGSVGLVVAAVAAVGLSSCGGGGSDKRAAKKPAVTTLPTTTTTVFVPTAPLTGLPDPTGVSQTRAALGVKIENTPEARPQSGLDLADVVYEEVVEGGITRFWAFFNTAAPTNVGPIRSVRFMDPNIVSPFGGVIAFSGGTSDNVALIRQTPTVQVDENNAGDAFFREASRFAPHNLYGVSAKLWERGGEPVPPKPMFQYLANGETFNGEGIDQFRVGFDSGYDPTYTFDPATKTWKRSYATAPFMDMSGKQVAPTNVIVQFVDYPRGAEGELIGQGDAWVFSANKLIRGRWVKQDAASPTIFVDSSLAPIKLTPGQTYVELAPTGSAVDLVASPPPPPTTVPPPTTTTTKAKKK